MTDNSERSQTPPASNDRVPELPSELRRAARISSSGYWAGVFLEAADEIQRLRGMRPELPPRPPDGEGLPRYGLHHNKSGDPISVPMADGYWTPWHLADRLRAALERARQAILTVDDILAAAGYSPDSSARNLLMCGCPDAALSGESQRKRAYYETHEPPHCPTCGCGLTSVSSSPTDAGNDVRSAHETPATPNRAVAIASLLDTAATLTDTERGLAADALRDYARLKRLPDETFARLARHGHFWTVEELQDGRWARAAQGHAWALEADARQQCEELRRRHGERLYRVTEYGSPQKAGDSHGG